MSPRKKGTKKFIGVRGKRAKEYRDYLLAKEDRTVDRKARARAAWLFGFEEWPGKNNTDVRIMTIMKKLYPQDPVPSMYSSGRWEKPKWAVEAHKAGWISGFKLELIKDEFVKPNGPSLEELLENFSIFKAVPKNWATL